MKSLNLISMVVICSSLISMQASAESSVHRSHSFELDDITSVKINAGVGSIEINHSQGSTLRVELEIEGKREGFFRRVKDVSEVDLNSRIQGRRLILDQSERNTSAHWVITLPDLEDTDISLGVGSVSADIGTTNLNVHVGVGEASISAPVLTAGKVDLSVGVGGANLRGAKNVDHGQAFVSQDVSGYGDGEFYIDIDIGVGDASVRLQQ